MLKLLFVGSDPSQGLLSYPIELAINLKRANICLDVVSWTKKGQPDFSFQLYKRLSEENISICIQDSLISSGILAIHKEVKQMSKFLEKEEYTHIHVHGPMSALLFSRALNRAKKKAVIVTAISRSFGIGLLANIKTFLSLWITAFFSDIILVLSKSEKKKVEKYRLPNKMVLVGYNPISINNFCKKDIESIDLHKTLNLNGNSVILGCYSNYNTVKRHLELLEAMCLVKDIDWHLILAGEGKELENIKLKIQYLNIEDKVTVLSRLPHEEIKQYLMGTNLVLNYSASETFGYCIVESLLLETPLLTTPVGIAEELADQNLIKAIPISCSRKELADYIRKQVKNIKNDGTKYREIREYIQARCDMDNYIKRLVLIYEHTI